MFVNIMFVVCILVGGDMYEKAASVSLLNCLQLAFL